MNNIKIAIGYLGHHNHRIEIHKVAFHYVKKIKRENKEKIHFLLMYNDNQNENDWKEIYEDLKVNNINVTIFKFPTKFEDGKVNYLNYLNKCIKTCEFGAEYCCKMDEDMWISNHSWDCIIENIDILEDSQYMCMTPIVSNGLPTTDFYIENVFSTEEINTLHNIFYNKKIDNNMWGVDYSSLNKFQSITSKWDSSLFYELVRNIPHHYKGIHPCRFSKEAQILINDYTLKHYNKISDLQDYNFYIDNPVYLCNGFHFIKTKTWIDIMNDNTLWPAGNAMDEVPMNLYKDRYNKQCIYLNNAHCVHLFHNGIENFDQLELEYIERYKKLIYDQ